MTSNELLLWGVWLCIYGHQACRAYEGFMASTNNNLGSALVASIWLVSEPIVIIVYLFRKLKNKEV